MRLKAIEFRLTQVEASISIIRKQVALVAEFLTKWEGGTELSRQLKKVENDD